MLISKVESPSGGQIWNVCRYPKYLFSV